MKLSLTRFSCSGTTAIVARNMGRKGIGIEMDKTYFLNYPRKKLWDFRKQINSIFALSLIQIRVIIHIKQHLLNKLGIIAKASYWRELSPQELQQVVRLKRQLNHFFFALLYLSKSFVKFQNSSRVKCCWVIFDNLVDKRFVGRELCSQYMIVYIIEIYTIILLLHYVID